MKEEQKWDIQGEGLVRYYPFDTLMLGRSCTRSPYLAGSIDENAGVPQTSQPILDRVELPATNRHAGVVCRDRLRDIDIDRLRRDECRWSV